MRRRRNSNMGNFLTTLGGGLLLIVAMVTGIRAFSSANEVHATLLGSVAAASLLGLGILYRISVRQRHSATQTLERDEAELLAQFIHLTQQPNFSITITARTQPVYAVAGFGLTACVFHFVDLSTLEQLAAGGLGFLSSVAMFHSLPNVFHPALHVTEHGLKTPHTRLIPWSAIVGCSHITTPRPIGAPIQMLSLQVQSRPEAIYRHWSIFRFSRVRNGVTTVCVSLINSSLPATVVASLVEYLWNRTKAKPRP